MTGVMTGCVRLFALLLGLLLTGCVHVDPIDGKVSGPPTLSVIGVRVSEQTADGVRLLVILEATNPNDEPVGLLDCSYTLTLGSLSRSFAADIHQTLPPRSVQTLGLPAAVPMREGVVGSAFVASGSIVYDPPGRLRQFLTESSVPLPSLSFRGEGQVVAAQPE